MNKNFKLLGTVSLILLFYRFAFYVINGWFSNPTLQGATILTVFALFSLITLGIGFGLFKVPQKVEESMNKWISPKPSQFTKAIFTFLLAGLLLSIGINYYFRCSLVSSICENIDLFVGLGFVFLILGFSEVFPKNIVTNFENSNVISFISKYFVVILALAHIIIKSILILPNAYSLIAPNDGIRYFALAKQYLEGVPDFVTYHHYPPFYSIVLAPVFLFDIKSSLKAIALVNILISTSALIPIYLISRKFVNRGLANLIILVSATSPFHFVYSIYPASENLYYPLFFWIIFLLVWSPRSNKFQWMWDILLGIMIGISYLTRYQTLPLVPAYALCYWLKPDTFHPERISIWPNKEKFIRVARMMLAFSIPLIIWIISGTQQGVGIEDLLGLTVEGKGSITSLNSNPGSFYLWMMITLGYFILIAGPTLSFLISNRWEKLHQQSVQNKYWLTIAFIITSIFFVIVFRHAWIAKYNDIEPTRLVTRYCIYIGVIFWLSTIFIIESGYKISWKRYLMVSSLAVLLIFGAYSLFFDRNWILKNLIIKFMYIDGHIPGFLGRVYFVILIISSLSTAAIMFLKKDRLLTPLLLLTIGIINLAAIPDFYRSVLQMEMPGRFLAELDNQILESLPPDDLYNNQYLITSYDEVVYPPAQLFTRGIDRTPFSFEQFTKSDLKQAQRLIYMQMVVNSHDTFQIIERKNITEDDRIISAFQFNGANFVLVNVPIP